MTARTLFREEFRLKNVWLNFEHHEAFVYCQWKWPKCVFFIYRMVFGLYTIGAFIHYIFMVEDINQEAARNNEIHHNVMVFITTWTYITLMLYFCASFLILLITLCKQEHENQMTITASSDNLQNENGIRNLGFSNSPNEMSSNTTNIGSKSVVDEREKAIDIGSHPDVVANRHMHSSIPWYSKLLWLVANVTSVWSVIVTMIYYVAIFPYTIGGAFRLHDVNVHLMNSVFVFIDTALCARPVKCLHIIYPFAYGIVYLIFSIMYWSFDRKNNVIYAFVLDWNNVGVTVGVMCGLSLVVLPLLQLMFLGLYKFRLYSFRKIYKHEYLSTT